MGEAKKRAVIIIDNRIGPDLWTPLEKFVYEFSRAEKKRGCVPVALNINVQHILRILIWKFRKRILIGKFPTVRQISKICLEDGAMVEKSLKILNDYGIIEKLFTDDACPSNAIPYQ